MRKSRDLGVKAGSEDLKIAAQSTGELALSRAHFSHRSAVPPSRQTNTSNDTPVSLSFLKNQEHIQSPPQDTFKTTQRLELATRRQFYGQVSPYQEKLAILKPV